ncbi:hypothetical protein Q73_16560 [Bacillus coahuilensis m2-6]|uniref:hypothetical protein n=1 Tax=Bacillus coahuilensis TaxID=408580 RepID=UPI00075052EC|nr:hypothetical protein [Bacillus coahuilensis]KUP03944.1 hypothetical protein Q73_16560 [Bacillus coahuilensis m2-6]
MDTSFYFDRYSYLSSIDQSLLPIVDGRLTKKLDIFQTQTFTPIMTAIEDGQPSITLKIIQNQRVVYERSVSSVLPIERNQQKMMAEKTYQPNEYYLEVKNSQNQPMVQFVFPKVTLQKGSYFIDISVNSNYTDQLNKDSLHVLSAGEIIVPPNMIENTDQATRFGNLGYAQDYIEITTHRVKGKKVMKNSPTSSEQWIIYTLDPVKVKEGEQYIFKTDVEQKGLRQFHGKVHALDTERVLYDSYFMEEDEGVKAIIDVKKDGYLQPTFLFNGSPDMEGEFSIQDAHFIRMSDITKVEGMHFLPSTPFNSIDQTDGYYILPEPYQDIWRIEDSTEKPFQVNFFLNGFFSSEGNREFSYTYTITKMLTIPYICGIILYFIMVMVLLFFLLVEKRKDMMQKKRRESWNDYETIHKIIFLISLFGCGADWPKLPNAYHVK